jgi:hypothetical protein
MYMYFILLRRGVTRDVGTDAGWQRTWASDGSDLPRGHDPEGLIRAFYLELLAGPSPARVSCDFGATPVSM